jgi:hypothetical protein
MKVSIVNPITSIISELNPCRWIASSFSWSLLCIVLVLSTGLLSSPALHLPVIHPQNQNLTPLPKMASSQIIVLITGKQTFQISSIPINSNRWKHRPRLRNSQEPPPLIPKLPHHNRLSQRIQRHRSRHNPSIPPHQRNRFLHRNRCH